MAQVPQASVTEDAVIEYEFDHCFSTYMVISKQVFCLSQLLLAIWLTGSLYSR